MHRRNVNLERVLCCVHDRVPETCVCECYSIHGCIRSCLLVCYEQKFAAAPQSVKECDAMDANPEADARGATFGQLEGGEARPHLALVSVPKP